MGIEKIFDGKSMISTSEGNQKNPYELIGRYIFTTVELVKNNDNNVKGNYVSAAYFLSNAMRINESAVPKKVDKRVLLEQVVNEVGEEKALNLSKTMYDLVSGKIERVDKNIYNDAIKPFVEETITDLTLYIINNTQSHEIKDEAAMINIANYFRHKQDESTEVYSKSFYSN